MSQQTSSSRLDRDKLQQPVSGSLQLNSDRTRPASRSRATSGSSVSGTGNASALTRQPSGGSTAGGRVGRASLGASGRSSTTTTTANTSVLSAATNAAARQPGPAAAATAAAPAPAAAATASAAAGSTAADAATPVPSVGGRTPFTPAVHFQSNAMFGEESSSMTPSVRNREYTPKLTPELQNLEQQQPHGKLQQQDVLAASTGAAAGQGAGTLAARSASATVAVHGESSARKAIVTSSGSSSSSSKKGEVKHSLPSTGDLFQMPDQQSTEAQLEVKVDGTLLVSPGWNQTRPWLTGSWIMQRPQAFLQETGGTGTPAAPDIAPVVDLAGVDPAHAEALLVDDLLTVFMGQAGQYIKHSVVEGDSTWPQLGMWVQGVQDPSLIEQVERLLPLCEHVFVIKRFIETRSRIEYPTVVQALAAAMRKLQEEWWLLVVQLEHQQLLGQLSLAGLLYYCQAPAASLALLAKIAAEAASHPCLTSAALLNLLVAKQRSLAGDRSGQQLVGQLLEAAAEPYFGILRQWLCLGVLDDPYSEFMIKEDNSVGRDSTTFQGEPAYWTQRYLLRRAVMGGDKYDVPEFLQSSKEAILVTGKYLNIFRMCGQPVPPCPDSTLSKLRYDAAAAECGSPPFLAGIQAALSAAAGALLAYMMGPQGRLMSWLHCLKHFFLLDQGDLLVHLMEAGDAESPTPLSSLASHQLQGLLDSALRSSSVAASPHMEVVGEGVLVIKTERRSILQLVTLATVAEQGRQGAGQDASLKAGGAAGWEDLMLGLNLAWPINLVVSKRQLLHYQALFKQLLSLKHAERQLGRVWQAMRATKRLNREDQARFRPWHLLCSQLLHLVSEVLRYTSIDVLEPLWRDMFTRLGHAGNMDEVIALHNAFLSAALDRSLLKQADVVQHMHALLAAAKELCRVAESLEAKPVAGTSVGGPSAGAFIRGNSMKPSSAAASHLRVLSKFCQNSNRQLELQHLQHRVQQELRQLLNKLDTHCRQLSHAPAAPAAVVGPAGSCFPGQVLPGAGRWGADAVVGDSSRELASLHNLIERLKLGLPGSEAMLF